MKIDISEFVTTIELNDFKVNSIDLDVKNREFKITFEGAYFFKESRAKPIIMEKGGLIKIRLYSSFEAFFYRSGQAEVICQLSKCVSCH